MYVRWHENAIFYSLSVDTFRDSNGDGMGDLDGVVERLDYLAGLGIDCVWLQPFYPSPMRDAGYDVAGFYDVDRRFGDLGDLVNMLDAAGRRGIRVLVDLVVNHTSTDHPWFQEARRDRTSPFRDFYIWRDEPPAEDEIDPMFPGAQSGVWTWDNEAQQYYLHRFYAHQPDLNIANPAVRDEILTVIRFWLRMGIAGFRVDAAPYIALKADAAEDLDTGHDFLRQIRELVEVYGDKAVLLAETDVRPDDYASYFGDPLASQMHLLFNFISNAHLFLSLAEQSARPLREALEQLPRPPIGAAYVNWVRNHDELNLARLDEDGRNTVLRSFAPDPEMRVYGRGIRRRFPPMVGGDRRLIELAYSLTFALPGVPMLLYGEEIGMGDDLSLPGRIPVRTVMQWSNRRHGGFSERQLPELRRPAIEDGEYGYRSVNVADQQNDPESLLNWITRLIRTRKIAWPTRRAAASYRIVDNDQRDEALVLYYDGADKDLLIVHNLTPDEVTVDVPVLREHESIIGLFADRDYASIDATSEQLRVGPFGYRWIQLR
ncbi:MAG: alpha-amylase family protein [Actinomycetota bacterium]|nr:alpha-amylase family protein [Actinomycetota bacterium]